MLLPLAGRRLKAAGSSGLKPMIVGLVAGLAFGVALSVTFFSGHESLASTLFFGLLPLALVLPVYQPECLLGFVLGMNAGFGAVLPTLFGSLISLAALVIYRFIGQPLQRLVGWRTRAETGGLE